jgi:hypothetical protein
MALSVLDGNQTATTLSSVVTGGEHIVAHSVVSLGANAIANITSAVSGSVVSVSNFPTSQSTTFGAVTGSVSVLNFPATQTIAGTVTANLSSSNLNAVTIGIRGSVTVGNIIGSGSIIGGFQDIFGNNNTFKVDIRTPDGSVLDGEASVPVQGTIDVGSLPAISGTVTVANTTISSPVFVKICGERNGAGSNEPMEIQTDDSGLLYVRLAPSNSLTSDPIVYDPVGGSAYINVRQYSAVTIGNSVTVGAMPNGALTTRFGSVTTANTAQITSAVTNTSRKYLLAQNISAGTVTIGIGFSPTTTQGIQLTAGAGLTFDAFCPTGAIYWLGAVTGAAWTILEG